MEELKQRLLALGINQEQIEGVLQTVMTFMKEKMPHDLHGILDSILHHGESTQGNGVGGLIGTIEGMFTKH